MKKCFRRLALALLASTALCEPTVAQTLSPAVYPIPLSGYYRYPFPWLPDNVAGFAYFHFTQWPGGEPPYITGYTNVNGNPLQMQTLYTTDTRTFTVAQVLAFHTSSATCNCDSVPAYYVVLQMSPSGQGFYSGQYVHDNYASYYFCCSYGDGNGQTLLVQWDTTTNSAAMSINGSPWLAPYNTQVQGLPFNVGIGSQNQYNLVDSDIVGYWPNFPQSSTNFIGAMAQSELLLWGNGYNPYTAVFLLGGTIAYPNNYGAGGAFSSFGTIDDYIIFGP